MKVSFDSNAWEAVFDPNWALKPNCDHIARIRSGLSCGLIRGFICDAAFRLEAILTGQRSHYFGQLSPHMTGPTIVSKNGAPYVQWSFGPRDELHPGLPNEQVAKLTSARENSIKVMRGLAWIFLPAAQIEQFGLSYISEDLEQRRLREQRQNEVFHQLQTRGKGMARLEAIRTSIDHHQGIEHAGWQALQKANDKQKRNDIPKAIAEWADAELAAAHVGYSHDVLCTEDKAGRSKVSTFDKKGRLFLNETHSVTFATLSELASNL